MDTDGNTDNARIPVQGAPPQITTEDRGRTGGERQRYGRGGYHNTEGNTPQRENTPRGNWRTMTPREGETQDTEIRQEERRTIPEDHPDTDDNIQFRPRMGISRPVQQNTALPTQLDMTLSRIMDRLDTIDRGMADLYEKQEQNASAAYERDSRRETYRESGTSGGSYRRDTLFTEGGTVVSSSN